MIFISLLRSNIMKIAILSPSYFPDLNGMTYATFSHVKLLAQMNHHVTIYAPSKHVCTTFFSASPSPINFVPINLQGNGLIWNRVRGDVSGVVKIIEDGDYDVIIVEGWYSWGAYLLPQIYAPETKKFLISHGTNKISFEFSIDSVVKAVGYRVYHLLYESKIYRSLSGVGLLSRFSDKKRFADSDLLIKYRIPEFLIPNTAFIDGVKKNRVINGRAAIIGEMSVNKNQLGLLKSLKHCSHLRELIFYSPEVNSYANSVILEAKNNYPFDILFKTGISRAGIHFDLAEIDILLVGSKTEAQPLVVIDAISLGIPFISTNVGCLSEIPGGVICNLESFSYHIDLLLSNPDAYNLCSNSVYNFYKSRHLSEVQGMGLEMMINSKTSEMINPH